MCQKTVHFRGLKNQKKLFESEKIAPKKKSSQNKFRELFLQMRRRGGISTKKMSTSRATSRGAGASRHHGIPVRAPLNPLEHP